LKDNAPVRSNDASANVSAAGGGANGQQDPRAAQASLSAPNVNAARSPAGGGADGVSGGNAAVPAGSSKKSNGGAGGGGGLSPQARFEIQPGPPLGKGHFAVVRKCRDTLTGKMCAVKIIDKKEMVKVSSKPIGTEHQCDRFPSCYFFFCNAWHFRSPFFLSSSLHCVCVCAFVFASRRRVW
jgi:hypothetical protein